MRSKLAVWSWIVIIIGLVLAVFGAGLSGENLGLGITFLFFGILGSAIVGLIFGIVALRAMSRNPKLTGRGHAITGIVLNGGILLTMLFITK